MNIVAPFSPALGRYRHYKGGLYLLIGVAETHHHNGNFDVVYVSLSHGKLVTRPLTRDSRDEDAWTDSVEWPDKSWRRRFTQEGAISEKDLAHLREMWPT